MFPAPSSWRLPPPWLQMSQPIQPGVVSFWEADHFRENLRRLQETLRLVKAVQKELETIIFVREFDGQDDKPSSLSKYSGNEDIVREFLKVIGEKGMDTNIQESFSLEAANSLIRSLREQLTPFSIVSSQTSSWEERSVAARLAQKLQKSKRNKRWRKKKRKQTAEKNLKEREMFDKADQEADEWRAKEIAKNIARRKVEKMKVIAMLKAKEERKRLESERKKIEKQNLGTNDERPTLVSGIALGFGNVAATAENLPPGFGKPELPEAPIHKKAIACCNHLTNCCCGMCCIQTCSRLSDQCLIVMTQLCTALSCFGCAECCAELCCDGSD